MSKKMWTAIMIDRDLLPILRQMEEVGVALDVSYLENLALDFRDQLADLASQIFDAVGHQFQISSPKQLGQVLFEELGLGEKNGVRLKKKTTGFSTAAAELQKLRDAHPVISFVLQYREVAKLLSTYVEPLPSLLGPDRRLHTHYAPDAASGRLSSRQPNLQNIPVRTDLGKKIRRAFVATPGSMFLAADYSQIELRVIAHLSQDAAMMKVFREGGDIHTATSTALTIDRRTAKAVNFGIFYGLTAYGLAESLGIDRQEAQGFIDGYLATYPQAAAYIEQLITTARERGYAETLFGRRRELPELTSGNDFLRRAAERVAVNHPIQGTAAELMKIAMIAVDQALSGQAACRMILQVHDELIFEVHEDRIDEFAGRLQLIMEGAYPLQVPLVVDAKVGQNWTEMEPIRDDN